jgi:hypothetical protein
MQLQSSVWLTDLSILFNSEFTRVPLLQLLPNLDFPYGSWSFGMLQPTKTSRVWRFFVKLLGK